MMLDETRLVPIAALQHYAFCPRQCALIHQDRLWNDNFHTARGNILHERVDSGVKESSSRLKTERNVQVSSYQYGLIGKLDVVETDLKTGNIYPVEYKKGKPKHDQWDCIQLCAQSFCLEEMLNINIEYGFLWYWQTRKREKIDVDKALRDLTVEVIGQIKSTFESNQLPKPVYDSKCHSCSLIDLCQPKLIEKDRSEKYCAALFMDVDK